jgi:hypothetical protein
MLNLRQIPHFFALAETGSISVTAQTACTSYGQHL